VKTAPVFVRPALKFEVKKRERRRSSTGGVLDFFLKSR
jgi:hypothetical protein